MILDKHRLEFVSHSPEQTRNIGMHLGQLLYVGDVICLQGNLGAGKTTFTQGIAQGWGSLDSVSSPTYVLVNQYHRTNSEQLFHLDTYRLDSILEAQQLDLDHYLNQGALIIEWPERLENLIPNENLWINLEHIAEEQRQMNFHAHGKRHNHLLDSIRQAMLGGA